MVGKFTKTREKAVEKPVEKERPKVSEVTNPTTGVPLEGHQLRKRIRRDALASEIQANLEKRKAKD